MHELLNRSKKKGFKQALYYFLVALFSYSCYLAGAWSHLTENVYLKSLPALLFITVFVWACFRLMTLVAESVGWKKDKILPLVGVSLLATLLLHSIYPNGPWHSLAIQNDAAHSLNMARDMANGTYTLSLFIPQWLGRVSLTMCFEALFFLIGDEFQLHWFILFFQSLFLTTLVLSAAALFPKFNEKVHFRWLLAGTIFLAFCPYVFFASTHLDMYLLAPLWMLMCLCILTLELPGKEKYNILWGLIIGAGLFIAPSTKVYVLVFMAVFAFRNWRNINILKYCFMGLLPCLFLYWGLYNRFGTDFLGREQWIFKHFFMDQIHNKGLIPFAVGRLELIYDSLFKGDFMYFIFDRMDFQQSAISIFSISSFLSVALLWVNRRLAVIAFLCLGIALAQIFVAEPADYRIIHVLPLWSLSMALCVLGVLKYKASRWTVLFLLPILLQLFMFYQIFTSIDYRYFQTHLFPKGTYWTSAEKLDGPRTQVATIQWGTSELFVPPENRQLGLGFELIGFPKKLSAIKNHLMRQGPFTLRVRTYEKNRLLSNEQAFKKARIGFKVRPIVSKKWPELSAYEIDFWELK